MGTVSPIDFYIQIHLDIGASSRTLTQESLKEHSHSFGAGSGAVLGILADECGKQDTVDGDGLGS